MASYGGTTQKCKACEKTVYLVDQLSTDGKIYHKSCFRCHHCKGTLKLSNYSSFEGVLYCMPHFDQLFKMTGSLDKSFEGAPRISRTERSMDQGQSNSKVASLFGGTQEKCIACKKTVYPIEKVTVDGSAYHKTCFRCSHGGCILSTSNYVAHEQRLYCKHHHSQLFKQKGDFSQLSTTTTSTGHDSEQSSQLSTTTTSTGHDSEQSSQLSTTTTSTGHDSEQSIEVTENTDQIEAPQPQNR